MNPWGSSSRGGGAAGSYGGLRFNLFRTAKLLYEVATPFYIPLAIYPRKGQHIFNRFNRLTAASSVTLILFHQHGKVEKSNLTAKEVVTFLTLLEALQAWSHRNPRSKRRVLQGSVMGVTRMETENSVPSGLQAA